MTVVPAYRGIPGLPAPGSAARAAPAPGHSSRGRVQEPFAPPDQGASLVSPAPASSHQGGGASRNVNATVMAATGRAPPTATAPGA
jgi:hypothetical protein